MSSPTTTPPPAPTPPAGTTTPPAAHPPPLRRPRQGRVLGGVCAGIAERTGLSPRRVRVLAVLSVFLPGPQFIAYLIAWAVIPSGDD